jgi:hypothetical protein
MNMPTVTAKRQHTCDIPIVRQHLPRFLNGDVCFSRDNGLQTIHTSVEPSGLKLVPRLKSQNTLISPVGTFVRPLNCYAATHIVNNFRKDDQIRKKCLKQLTMFA